MSTRSFSFSNDNPLSTEAVLVNASSSRYEEDWPSIPHTHAFTELFFHALRTQTHGNKAPPEYRKPKCLLFNCWLEEPYKKCEPCRRACAEVDEK